MQADDDARRAMVPLASGEGRDEAGRRDPGGRPPSTARLKSAANEAHRVAITAIEELRLLKEEHRPILLQIAADPGMSAESRAALVKHLLDEEDEHVARLVSLHPPVNGEPPRTGDVARVVERTAPVSAGRDGAATAPSVLMSRPADEGGAGRLTVGSLRDGSRRAGLGRSPSRVDDRARNDAALGSAPRGIGSMRRR